MTRLRDLRTERAALEAQIQAQKAAAVLRVVALMKELGVSWEDMGVVPMTRTKKSRRVKYRDEQGRTWAGVGQRPRWLAARLLAGATLDQFRVKD